jgi:hypothetical protein
VAWIGLAQGRGRRRGVHSNKPSDSIECGEYAD